MTAHFLVCCGNSEETTQCYYKLGGLTVDATRDTTNRVAVVVHYPVATTEVKFLTM